MRIIECVDRNPKVNRDIYSKNGRSLVVHHAISGILVNNPAKVKLNETYYRDYVNEHCCSDAANVEDALMIKIMCPEDPLRQGISGFIVTVDIVFVWRSKNERLKSIISAAPQEDIVISSRQGLRAIEGGGYLPLHLPFAICSGSISEMFSRSLIRTPHPQ